MRVELLLIDDCPSHEAVLPLLRRLIDEAGTQAPVSQQLITSCEDADQRDGLSGIPVEALIHAALTASASSRKTP